MSKRLLNSKGAAMELAIGTSILVGALCMLLLLVVELTGYLNARTTNHTNERLMVDRIGEQYYVSRQYNVPFNYSIYNASRFTFEITDLDENTQSMAVYSLTEVGPALLWVEVEGVGQEAKIVRWSYGYGAIHSIETEEAESGD